MDPLVAIGLFVGIPVGLAALITLAVMVPRGYARTDIGARSPESSSRERLITSSRAVPNPAALPSLGSARADVTGGAHGTW